MASGFWKRNFSGEATRGQVHFDYTVAILFSGMAFLLFLVFNATAGFFYALRLLGLGGDDLYGADSFEALLSLAFLMSVARFGSKSCSRLLAGLFMAGALNFCLAGMEAASLLHFSFYGPIYGPIEPMLLYSVLIAVPSLGLFTTAFVFFRNGWRTIEAARIERRDRRILPVVLLTVILIFGIPVGTVIAGTAAMKSSMERIIDGDQDAFDGAVASLKIWRFVTGLEPLEKTWFWSPDPEQQERLSKAYEEITGRRFDRGRLQYKYDD